LIKKIGISEMSELPLIWIMMGVSGAGKTTLGRLFSKMLECDFLEGDRRHPRKNIEKMHSDEPLEDKDRHLWLLEIEDDIRRAIIRQREIVITCSALKKVYRERLASLGQVQFIYLKVEQPILEERLKERPNHYMSAKMLASQIATLEEVSTERNVLTVNGNSSIDVVMSDLKEKVTQEFPDFTKSWWER
jgi:gluconokinase